GCYALDVIFKILTYKKISTFMIHLLLIKRFYLKKWPSYSVLKFMRFRWDTLYNGERFYNILNGNEDRISTNIRNCTDQMHLRIIRHHPSSFGQQFKL